MTSPEKNWQVPASSERPKASDSVADAVIASIWKEYLILRERGNATISFQEFEELLKVGVSAAAKKQKQLLDEKIDAQIRRDSLAKWVDDHYGHDYD